jgi:hypothetical protein
MWGVLNFTWKPTATEPTCPDDKAPMPVRGDTFDWTFSFTMDGDPFTPEGEWAAQLRPEALSTEEADEPTAVFTVDVVDDGVTITLTAAQTKALPVEMETTSYRWDLQQTIGDHVQTVVAGAMRVAPDVTR